MWQMKKKSNDSARKGKRGEMKQKWARVKKDRIRDFGDLDSKQKKELMKMNIDEMVAGRETNLSVAMKVFGRNEHYYDCPHIDGNGRLLSFCGCPSLPRYSVDIAAAWQVVEHMRGDYRTTIASDTTGTLWHCKFETLDDDPFPYFSTNQDTAPLAICKAALKAKEGR